jgi:hypothetical protein
MKLAEGGKTVIHSLALETVPAVRSVTVLGYDGPAIFAQTRRGLEIVLPEQKPDESSPWDHSPDEFAQCYRIRYE